MTNLVEQRVMEMHREYAYEPAEVFRFWVTPSLLEQWSRPDGMSLEIPKFEARVGGEYHYVHKNEQGLWDCTGAFKDFQRNVRIVMMDKQVKNPRGEVIYQNLECIVDFKDCGGSTQVHIRQKGFPDMQGLRECKQGWTQCLDKLDVLLAAEGVHPHRKAETSAHL